MNLVFKNTSADREEEMTKGRGHTLVSMGT